MERRKIASAPTAETSQIKWASWSWINSLWRCSSDSKKATVCSVGESMPACCWVVIWDIWCSSSFTLLFAVDDITIATIGEITKTRAIRMIIAPFVQDEIGQCFE
ncbi:hypothetical protein [Clostridium facile]|uniref:Uncharacterized protein n=1 Tax=Clostridium facile TaxID=2763035 RepID=A0ABR7IQ23_9CLOT|nr:hypothetical protein [Clostridium facile]MBC5786957.1 hypothetical protein [Clostridium facile]